MAVTFFGGMCAHEWVHLAERLYFQLDVATKGSQQVDLDY